MLSRYLNKHTLIISLVILQGCSNVQPKLKLTEGARVIDSNQNFVTIEHINLGTEVTLTQEVLDMAELFCRSRNREAEYRQSDSQDFSGPERFYFACVPVGKKQPIRLSKDDETWLLAQEVLPQTYPDIRKSERQECKEQYLRSIKNCKRQTSTRHWSNYECDVFYNIRGPTGVDSKCLNQFSTPEERWALTEVTPRSDVSKNEDRFRRKWYEFNKDKSRDYPRSRQNAWAASNNTSSWRPHSEKADFDICYMVSEGDSNDLSYAKEAMFRSLNCDSKTVSSSTKKASPTSTKQENTAQEDMERFQADFLSDLESDLSFGDIASGQDESPPKILIVENTVSGPRGILKGKVSDQSGIAELQIDGSTISISFDGSFNFSTYVPIGEKKVRIVATDYAGLSSTKFVILERQPDAPATIRFPPVNPLRGPVQTLSKDRAALIIGLEQYATSQPAKYAARDAQMFADYAKQKLGVSSSKIKIMQNSEATEVDILRALLGWLPSVIEPSKTELYVFFAGHGMPSPDGQSAYLVPYDGDVSLLRDTTISQKRFFSEIAASKPQRVNIFFDMCYSGLTRGNEALTGNRPLRIKIVEHKVPENFTVFSAGQPDQWAGVLDPVEHGRFSYFLFRGLEGESDRNKDGIISSNELQTYLATEVARFSGRKQIPAFWGDGNNNIIE